MSPYDPFVHRRPLDFDIECGFGATATASFELELEHVKAKKPPRPPQWLFGLVDIALKVGGLWTRSQRR